MVNLWPSINPLTIEERRKIMEGLALDMSYSQLALHVGRCKSTVLRESKRLGNIKDYDPDLAQKDFENKMKRFGNNKNVS